ncbi:diffusible signal factor-reguated Ax21 faimly protein [Novilysobacter spongiicola]|uniref:Sulfation-dependent quorum factor, Ax21 family n=1 Tax=Lysobacter spongiicola DSM 21749 TaxID=1122188 RepID=A0A1T4Q749_9GAMM|nr:diffusible signal factor-reguated Ax21 faimly protein [Lysobacter spongiicola]SJZ99351.1 sulfation-dependent quorum factor, Ax21 family [Lysobacter spongiicola DSM 21749]
MKKSLLALTLLAALPFAASAADGVSYNYVEAGYAATEVDDNLLDIDRADGWAINGSAAIAPNFHLFGGYSGQKTEDFAVDGQGFEGVEIDEMRLGVGYNHEISPRADLLTRVAYERFEDEFDNSFNGYSVEAGVRGALTTNLEGYALAGYADGGSDYDGDFYGRLGAQVKFNPMWGLSGDVKFTDGDTQYFIGPRITF